MGHSPSTKTAHGESATAAEPREPSLPEHAEGAGVIRQGPRKAAPGSSARPKRVKEWILLTKLGLLARAKEHGEKLTDGEAQRQAEEAFQQFRRQQGSKDVLKQLEKTEPTSRCPERSGINSDVEVAAAQWHPVMRWFTNFMLRKTNRRGGPAKRSLVLAVFLRMAFAAARPEIARTREELQNGRPLVNWAHGYPDGGPGRKHFYDSLHTMLKRKPATVLNHVNVELIRQLAELRDEKGELRHPDVGKVAFVDGSLIQAPVEQRGVKSVNGVKSKEHRDLLWGSGREMVDDVVYTDNEGRLLRYTAGYKLMVLVDAASTLPLVFCLIPADGDERHAARDLLRLLFQLWPECPLETLVGDSLYDHDRAIAHELVFNWGVQPCFPRHGTYSRNLPHVDTDGVPECACGELMKFKDKDPLLDAKSRARKGIPRGQEAGLSARLRWKCRNGLCKDAYTRPFDDPRLYTVLHRAGDHANALKRTALLLRRNAVESVFASLKRLGLGGKDQERPQWAKDVEMDWLLAAGLVFQSARRLAHETGLYQAAHDEAELLGLLVQPTESEPAVGPSELELARAVKARQLSLDASTPPRTWVDEDKALPAEPELLALAA